MKTYPYEWVWMTTQRHGTPHAQALQAANPGLVIHLSAPPAGDSPDAYHHAWRNCDRNIRAWWLAHRLTVTADLVVFAEYDVLCTADIRDHIAPLAPGDGIAGPRVMSCLRDARHYWPFRDIPRLPRVMQGLAIATAPLAVLLISRAALDAIFDPVFDEVFATDIFCELRMPTVIRYLGFGVASLDLPQVHCTPYAPPPRHGIFHPVKPSVP
jgi:hypothetical protein